MAENEGSESIQVEKMLMKFEDIPNRDRLKLGVFSIEIESVGCWIVKFRKSGVIVNNRDLILSIVPDALIHFKSFSSFMRTMDGGSTLNDEVGKGQLSLSGPPEALESFHNKWLRICDLPNTINADIPTRSVRLPSMDKVQPLKAGWLLKKRDIFSGWRCRYFVVYPDRLEYFIDQYDSTPKATMSLIDVEVQPVKRVNMPGVGEHWGIIVTTKNPKSTFRLASEMTGIEGMVECSTWEKVFSIARQSCEQYLEDIVSDSEASRLKQRQSEKQAAENTRLSVRTASPKGKRSSFAKFGGISGVYGSAKEWGAYAVSKQGAPRVLLCIASVVLIVRLVWNVTRIQQMFRNMLFHSVVAVLVLVILFFLKSIFTEYFSSDDTHDTEESGTACMNTIAPCTDTATPASTTNTNTAMKLSLVPPTNTTEHKSRKRLFNFGNRNKSSTAGGSAQDSIPKPSAQDSARRAASPLVSRNSSDGPRYGGVSPLPPHIISTKPGVGIAEHPMNTSTMKNVTNTSSDDS